MSKDAYLLMCEELGNEPIESEIPIEFSDFPYMVQLAIIIFNTLPDRWEGFSGTYMGKDYSILEFIMGLYDVDDKQLLFKLINNINSIVLEQRTEEQKRKQKSKTSKKGK